MFISKSYRAKDLFYKTQNFGLINVRLNEITYLFFITYNQTKIKSVKYCNHVQNVNILTVSRQSAAKTLL